MVCLNTKKENIIKEKRISENKEILSVYHKERNDVFTDFFCRLTA